jgi:hypothetical protein
MSSDNEYVQPDLPSRSDLPAPATPPDRRNRRGRDEEEDEDHPRSARRYSTRRSRQQAQDEDHLRILSILHYVFGGLLLLGGFFPLLYVGFGILMLSGALNGPNTRNAPPPGLAWFFIVFFGAMSLLVWALGLCTLFAGYNLSHRSRYLFCFIVAAICCIQMPLGTILGVFTIIVLSRPSVKEMFEGHSPEPEREYDEYE